MPVYGEEDRPTVRTMRWALRGRWCQIWSLRRLVLRQARGTGLRTSTTSRMPPPGDGVEARRLRQEADVRRARARPTCLGFCTGAAGGGPISSTLGFCRDR